MSTASPSPVSQNPFAPAISARLSPQRGLTDAQLSAADRVLQREGSRSRMTARLGAIAASASAKHPA